MKTWDKEKDKIIEMAIIKKEAEYAGTPIETTSMDIMKSLGADDGMLISYVWICSRILKRRGWAHKKRSTGTRTYYYKYYGKTINPMAEIWRN